MNSSINGGKALPSTLFRRDVAARTAGAVTKSAGGYAIADTSTTAKVGDIYRAETATTSVMVDKEYLVIEASTNSFTIASKDLPTLGDTFFILAPVSLRVDDTGAIATSVAGGATEAKQDTMITSLQLLDNAVSGNEFQVDVVAPLPAGTNNIGDVDVLSSALPTGASTSALQSTIDASINTLLKPADTLAAVTSVGTVTTLTGITNALPAGDNNIGNVDIVTMPAVTSNSDVEVTGNITTQNLNLTGAATANSAVETGDLTNGVSGTIQITGTHTGTVTVGITLDGSTWVNHYGSSIVNMADGTYSNQISSGTNGIFRLNIVGVKRFRVQAASAVTGTIVVTIRTSSAHNGLNPITNQKVDLVALSGSSLSAGKGNQDSGVRVTFGNENDATVASVAASASNVTLLASDSVRSGASFYNDSTSALYLKYGTTASTSSFTVKIPSYGYFELPIPVYYGTIDGIWDSATGNCRVTSW